MSGELYSGAADRNKDHILARLRALLPAEGTVLELGSGTGQHAVHFAGGLPALRWQPSEQDPALRRSIAGYGAQAALDNLLLPPLAIDLASDPERWPLGELEPAAMVCINVIHISPWAVTEGLMAGAARWLRRGGRLITYGPMRIDGEIAPSNLAFDEDLRQRDPGWGVRELREVEAVADAAGLALRESLPTPTNNQTLVWERR